MTRFLAAVLVVLAGPTLSLWAQPFSTEEVTFQSDDVTLVGSILVPTGTGPFPGLVLVHGSGSSSRDNPWTSAYAEALVRKGIVVLHPDKRGSGDSGGSWLSAGIEHLARDAVAAAELLAGRPEVDASRLGLVGFSQGGHVIPVAASMSPEIDFLINISGSVVPILEQIGDELRLAAAREGLDEVGLRAVADIHDRAVAFAIGGGSWTAYRDALAHAASLGLSETEVISGFPTDPESPAWGFLQALGDFAPLPYWQSLTIPVAFVYGGNDHNVDVPKSARLITEVLSGSRVEYTLQVFGSNGHALFREDLIAFLSSWIAAGGRD